VELQEHADQGLRELVREQIRQRRYEPVVRIQFAPGPDPHLRQILQERFAVSDTEIYVLPGELDYTGLLRIASLPLPGLRDRPYVPVVPARLADGEDLFETIQAGDLLVDHPYESFDESAERFIRAAASVRRPSRSRGRCTASATTCRSCAR
jgi:polyphosphate kinase